jgi:hypothetical protein
MAFAPQFGALMTVPSVDHDMDMLSDAPEEGHDFDIDVDAMSDAEDRDVDFVLDDENAPETSTETVDQEMREATTDPKTVDAPMGEPEPDEVMHAVPVNGPGGDLQTAHDSFSAQNTAVDAGLLAPQENNDQTVLAAALAVPLASFEAEAKTAEDHALPTADPEAGTVQPGPDTSREPQAEKDSAQIATDPHVPAPEQDRTLVTDESKNDDSQEQAEQVNVDDQNEAEGNEERDPSKKPSLSDCAALVSYDGSQLSLFPPVDGLPEAYLIDDLSLAERALRELFDACREALGASLGDDSQLQMEIHGLQIVLEEVCNPNILCMLTVGLGLRGVLSYHAA